MSLLINKRDEICGWKKYFVAAIFAWMLVAPCLVLITIFEDKFWVMSFILIMIGLILWSYWEYCLRSKIWFVCLCRGIIVDFDKTDTAKRWATQVPMYFSYGMIVLSGLLTYLGDTQDERQVDRIITSVMFLLGLTFVIFLCKSIVDLEGANKILTLNLFVNYFEDPLILASKGFKVIHQT